MIDAGMLDTLVVVIWVMIALISSTLIWDMF